MGYWKFKIALLKCRVLLLGIPFLILFFISYWYVALTILLPLIITFIIAFANVTKELPKQRLEQQMMENRIKKVLDFKQAHMDGELQHLTHTEEFLSQAENMLFEINAILTQIKTKEYLKAFGVYRGELVGEQAVLEYILNNRNEE